jgi:menaquinone-dependent protoporphyrinogen oxidase
MTILVTYATKHGSTREVAETIAAGLRERGLRAEVRAAADANDIAGFEGVVVGGALYMGRWHADARRFLRRHRKALADLPLAVFAMGPLTTTEKDVAASRRQLDHALARVSEVEPVSIGIFGGVVDPAKLRFPFSSMAASDARDWDAITRWADEVADAFGAVPAVGVRKEPTR